MGAMLDTRGEMSQQVHSALTSTSKHKGAQPQPVVRIAPCHSLDRLTCQRPSKSRMKLDSASVNTSSRCSGASMTFRCTLKVPLKARNCHLQAWW